MMKLIIIGGLIVVCLIAALMMGLLEGLGISESSDEEYEFVDFMSTPAPAPAPSLTPSPSAEDEEDEEDEEDFGEPFLEFSKDACFGACPVYTVLVFRNGKVVYDGIKDVPFTGKFETMVSEDKITEYLTQAVTHNFWEMNSEYDDSQVTDLPASIITYRDGVLEKTVRARYNIPQNVTDLISYLHKEFDGLATTQASQT